MSHSKYNKRGKSLYLDNWNPNAKKYINECSVCGHKGYSPAIEQHDFLSDTNKDPFTFYNIAKNLVKKYKNVIFIYIGDGPCKVKIQNQIEKDNVDRILLLGFKKNVDNWLRIMDIFLMTSLHEALPYSIIEALAHSLPIVATNVTGINELVIDNYNGFLFNNSNVFDGVKSSPH